MIEQQHRVQWFVLNIADEDAQEGSFVLSAGQMGFHAVPITCDECGFSMAQHRDCSDEVICYGCGLGIDIHDIEFPATEERLLRGAAEAVFGCIDCENGEPCRRAMWECPFQVRSAVMAGIPRRVIEGTAKISDYVTAEYIRAQANNDEVQS